MSFLQKSITLTLLTLVLSSAGAIEISVNPSVGNNTTGGNDLTRLKHLTMAVGWEFSPNAESTAALKKLGVKKIRCINVDGLPGSFDNSGNYIIDESHRTRLATHLATCKELNAAPHIIIGQRMPKALLIKAKIKDDGISLMGGGKKSKVCGPSDYRLYRNYWLAYFEYVVIKKGFTNAVFEVFNEPDIGGVICPTPNIPARGSAALYEVMFKLYSETAKAATEFEKKHPEHKLTIGGPALAWAYTFRFGSFNWAERFVKDCAKHKLKLDFIGVHFYGNISSISGEYKAGYPSFLGMLKSLRDVRDNYLPGVPVQINEWGPSYHTNNSPKSLVNADNIGAAWSMEFLKVILENNIRDAIYLVTTDLYQRKRKEKENIWGWPSLMVNPQIFGHPYPKAQYNLFKMISELNGSRVESTRADNINSFAVADRAKKKIQVIIWNFAAKLPENAVPLDFSQRESVSVNIQNATTFFATGEVKATRTLISRNNSNAIGLWKEKIPFSIQNTSLQTTDQGNFKIIDNSVSLGYNMPPSSIAMIEIEPAKMKK